MEKPLWACYKKGIKTSGCHAGTRPYIDFKYQDNLEKLIPLLEVTQEEKGSQILILLEYNKRTLSEEKFNRWLEDKKIEYGII